MVNQYTRRITGFEANSLVNGKESETVRKEVKQLLKGKLVIIDKGGADFRALDIDQSDFKFFDLQEVFQKWNGKFNRLGNKNFEPIGLRHVFYHYITCFIIVLSSRNGRRYKKCIDVAGGQIV
jgi:hypothetical protein